MKVLLEVPISFLKHTYTILGSNNISMTIIDQLLRQPSYTWVIVSDTSDEESLYFSEYLSTKYGSKITVVNYNSLLTILSNISIQLAFVTGIDLQRLLLFRKINAFNFPIIGLVHNCATRTTLTLLKSVIPYFMDEDVLICPSQSTQKLLLKIGFKKENTVVIPYGVDQNIFLPKPHNTALRHRLNIPEDKVVLLCLTRITPSLKMDLLPLFRLLPTLFDSCSNLHLLCVGHIQDPSYFNELTRYLDQHNLNDSVQFITSPNHDNMAQYYQVADFFISLSDAAGESFGLTVVEAMSSGLPVIISDYAGYRSFEIENKIDDKQRETRSGYKLTTYSAQYNLDSYFYYHDIFDYGDIYAQSIAIDHSELQKAVLNLSNDAALRKKMSKNARDLALRYYNVEDMISAYTQLFLNKMNKQVSKNTSFKLVDRNLFSIFEHLPNVLLKDNDVLSLTQSGLHVVNGEQTLVMFEHHEKRYILVQDILYLLSREDSTYSYLLSMCIGAAQDITLSTLYLLKHGFIELKS